MKPPLTLGEIPGTPSPSSARLSAKRAITPATSIRFDAYFGQSPEFWHGIQVECDSRALAKQQKKHTADSR